MSLAQDIITLILIIAGILFIVEWSFKVFRVLRNLWTKGDTK